MAKQTIVQPLKQCYKERINGKRTKRYSNDKFKKSVKNFVQNE